MHHSPLQKLSSFLICNSHHLAGEPVAAGGLLEPRSPRRPSFLNSQSVLPQPIACHRQQIPWLFGSHRIQQITKDDWHTLFELQEYVHQSQRSWCQRRQNPRTWTQFYRVFWLCLQFSFPPPNLRRDGQGSLYFPSFMSLLSFSLVRSLLKLAHSPWDSNTRWYPIIWWQLSNQEWGYWLWVYRH